MALWLLYTVFLSIAMTVKCASTGSNVSANGRERMLKSDNALTLVQFKLLISFF